MPRARKPQPKPTNIVCTECGLDWEKHKTKKDAEPTLADCVRLLKAELAKQRTPYTFGSGSSVTWPLYGNTLTTGH